jgi:hypothetical protein
MIKTCSSEAVRARIRESWDDATEREETGGVDRRGGPKGWKTRLVGLGAQTPTQAELIDLSGIPGIPGISCDDVRAGRAGWAGDTGRFPFPVSAVVVVVVAVEQPNKRCPTVPSVASAT